MKAPSPEATNVVSMEPRTPAPAPAPSSSPSGLEIARELGTHSLGFTKSYVEMLSNIARPPGGAFPQPLHPDEVRVTLALVQNEWAAFRAQSDGLRHLIAELEDECIDLHRHGTLLQRTVGSFFRNLLDSSVDSEQHQWQRRLNDFHGLLRQLRALALVWAHRPAEFRPQVTAPSHVIEESFQAGPDHQQRVQNTVGAQYDGCQVTGTALQGLDIRDTRWTSSRWSHLQLVVGEPPSWQKIRGAWASFHRELRSLTVLEEDQAWNSRDRHLEELQHQGQQLLQATNAVVATLSCNGAELTQCQITNCRIATTTAAPLEFFRIIQGTINGLDLTGSFRGLTFEGIASAQRVTLDQTVLMQSRIVRCHLLNLVLRETTVADTDLLELDVHGGTFRNVRFIGGRQQVVTYADLHLSGTIHFEAAMSQIRFVRPIIAPDTVFSGLARGITIEDAAGMLPNLDILDWRIVQLSIVRSAPLTFQRSMPLDPLIAKGLLIVDDAVPTATAAANAADSEAPPSPEEQTTPVVIRSVAGVQVMYSEHDTGESVLNRAVAREDQLRDILAGPWRARVLDVYRSHQQELTAVGPLLAQLRCVPILTSSLRHLLHQAQVFQGFTDTEFLAEVDRSLLSTGDCATTVSAVRDALTAQQYLQVDLRKLQEVVQKRRLALGNEQQTELAQHDVFGFFLEQFRGTDEEFTAAFTTFMQDEFPHLTFVHPRWARHCWHQHQRHHEKNEFFADGVPPDGVQANRLKMRQLQQYYQKEGARIRADQSLSDDERAQALEELELLKDREFAALMTASTPSSPPPSEPGGTGNDSPLSSTTSPFG